MSCRCGWYMHIAIMHYSCFICIHASHVFFSFFSFDRAVPSNKVTELQDQLDVANLQSRLLEAAPPQPMMGTSSHENEEEQEGVLSAATYHALGHEFIRVSDLFYVYAYPMEMYEFCLLIVNICKNNDTDTIDTLWQNILCRELENCGVWSPNPNVSQLLTSLGVTTTEENQEDQHQGSNSNDNGSSNSNRFEDGRWAQTLSDKISGLGQDLYGSGADYTFPLSFLIPKLEDLRMTFMEATDNGRNSADSSAVHPWVVKSMVQAGVPYDVLFQSYNLILVEKERSLGSSCSQEEKMHYLKCLTELLTHWIKDANTGRNGRSSSSAVASMTRRGGGPSPGGAGSENNSPAVLLGRALSGGGLRNLIDNYKSSLESMVGGNTREVEHLLDFFTSIERSLS
jgi:nuclear pore complex protein Nup155